MRYLPILLLLLLCIPVEARLPAVGDHVLIQTSYGLCVREYDGNITNTSDEMICLHCYSIIQKEGAYLQNSKVISLDPQDVCIGNSTINQMTWI